MFHKKKRVDDNSCYTYTLLNNEEALNYWKMCEERFCFPSDKINHHITLNEIDLFRTIDGILDKYVNKIHSTNILGRLAKKYRYGNFIFYVISEVEEESVWVYHIDKNDEEHEICYQRIVYHTKTEETARIRTNQKPSFFFSSPMKSVLPYVDFVIDYIRTVDKSIQEIYREQRERKETQILESIKEDEFC